MSQEPNDAPPSMQVRGAVGTSLQACKQACTRRHARCAQLHCPPRTSLNLAHSQEQEALARRCFTHGWGDVSLLKQEPHLVGVPHVRGIQGKEGKAQGGVVEGWGGGVRGQGAQGDTAHCGLKASFLPWVQPWSFLQ